MRGTMNIGLCMTLMATSLSANAAETTPFTGMSARTLEQGAWSVGVFEPLRYGLKDDLTLSVRPLVFALAPNIGVKKQWGSVINGVVLSTEHTLSSPTMLFRQLAGPGIGGILPPDSEIPWSLTSRNTVFMSSDITEEALTTWLSLELGVGFGENNFPTIDVPLAYRKTAVAQNGVALLGGMRSEELLTTSLGYVAQVQGWMLPQKELDWGMEIQLEGLWQPTSGFRVHSGALMTYGEFPYGDNWHILPTVDLVWAWGGGKSAEAPVWGE